MKLCEKLYFYKILKNMQGKLGMKYFAHSRRGYVVIHAGFSKPCNFITSWELNKTPEIFVQGSFPMKSLQLCHINRGEFLVSGLLWVHF